MLKIFVYSIASGLLLGEWSGSYTDKVPTPLECWEFLGCACPIAVIAENGNLLGTWGAKVTNNVSELETYLKNFPECAGCFWIGNVELDGCPTQSADDCRRCLDSTCSVYGNSK